MLKSHHEHESNKYAIVSARVNTNFAITGFKTHAVEHRHKHHCKSLKWASMKNHLRGDCVDVNSDSRRCHSSTCNGADSNSSLLAFGANRNVAALSANQAAFEGQDSVAESEHCQYMKLPEEQLC